MSIELVKYDAMCSAIAECHSVDEVKDLHDKALALELYAKQARNTDAERKACEVRLRAERRAGELFMQMERTPKADAGALGGNAKAGNVAPATAAGASEYRAALEQSGVSERTAQRWQELSSVPAAEFEDAMRAPEKPSTSGIITASKKPAPKMDGLALWLWGRARDFERDGVVERGPKSILGGMTETMLDDMVRIAPMIRDFYVELCEVLNERA